MFGNSLRVVAVLALALILTIGMTTVPQAQQKPFTVCSDIPWNPFEMVTASGEFFGFDLDVMRAIAITEGYEITIANTPFDSIIPAIQAGKCDIGASGFTNTSERAQVVDFSNPYWLSNQAVLIRKDSGFTKLDDVFCCGHKIGAQRGTTGADWVQKNLVDQGKNVTLVLYETYPLAILDLVNKRIDAVVQDEPASQQSLRAYPDLIIVGIIETNEYFGFPVAKGDPQGLLPKFNDGMNKLGLRVALQRIKIAEGRDGWLVQLQIIQGTPWDNLVKAYFSAAPDKLEAAWNSCKDLILTKKDVAGYATCMAADATK